MFRVRNKTARSFQRNKTFVTFHQSYLATYLSWHNQKVLMPNRCGSTYYAILPYTRSGSTISIDMHVCRDNSGTMISVDVWALVSWLRYPTFPCMRGRVSESWAQSKYCSYVVWKLRHNNCIWFTSCEVALVPGVSCWDKSDKTTSKHAHLRCIRWKYVMLVDTW